MEDGNEGWKTNCFETGLKDIFYLEISDAASYKSELRSAALACMVLILLEAVEEPSSSRKNMRTSGGESNPSGKSTSKPRLLAGSSD